MRVLRGFGGRGFWVFRVVGLGFRVGGLGFQGCGFRVLGMRVWGFRVVGFGFRAVCFERFRG